jgi:DNA-binding LacI/PurR family transcriptional regulator
MAMSKANGTTKEHVTLQTIADRLGLSRTTISNAYGRPDQLAPELRAKILETAKALGYAGPNAAARMLRRGRADAIGFLTSATLSYTVTDPAAVQLFQGIAEVLDERGLSLVTLPAPRNAETGIEAARGAVVDGFLVFCVPDGNERLQAIFERQLPIVTIDEPRVDGAAFVGIDDRAGARRLAEHLFALGHRQIGVLTLPLWHDGREGFADLERQAAVSHSVSRERLAGFRDAFAAAGISWESVPVFECLDHTRQFGERGAGALLDRVDRPSALLACADLIALGAIQAAVERGLRIPADLSIAGFDDIPEARFGHPPLTTIRQPLREKGAAAARFIVDGWSSERPPRLVLPTELVVRASTGPAA